MERRIQFQGRPVWAEIHLGALAYNLRAIRRHVHSAPTPAGRSRVPPKILAVVKANAYGHGAVPVARALARGGADWFGVTCSAEGIELREGGIRKPILLLTGFWPGEEKKLIEHNLTPTVIHREQLGRLERAAARARRGPASFHLKIQNGHEPLRYGTFRTTLFCADAGRLSTPSASRRLYAFRLLRSIHQRSNRAATEGI